MIEHINGADLYYEECGEGSRYILASAQVFDHQHKGWPYDLAEEGFHLFFIQTRGYGKSSHIYQNYESNWYDVWADDVAEFARAKGISRFFYTGQSDGAGIGWHLLFRHPERLVGFAGLAPGPHARDNTTLTQPRRRSMATVNDPVAREEMAQYQRRIIAHYAEKFADIPELREEFLEKAEDHYYWELEKNPEEKLINPGIVLSQYRTNEELENAMSCVHVPVLLFYGMKDAMLPLSRSFLPMAYIPGAKTIFYQDASNLIQYDHREDVREEISRFAGKLFDRMA